MDKKLSFVFVLPLFFLSKTKIDKYDCEHEFFI